MTKGNICHQEKGNHSLLSIVVEEFLEFLRFGGKSELAGMGSMSSSGSFDGFAVFHLSRENGNEKPANIKV